MANLPYLDHCQSSTDLVTTYEATRAGFIALALEKNRLATPHVVAARALQEAVSKAKQPTDLLTIRDIETGLLTAAGLSNKACKHLQTNDKERAIKGLIQDFLAPAGEKFIEELIFRFLLTRGETLGGTMRNLGGALAQKKLTRAIISALTIAGISAQWWHAKADHWMDYAEDDTEIESSLRGLSWEKANKHRTLIYNLKTPVVNNSVDMCLFDVSPDRVNATVYNTATSYIALGELKGGIDPAGADEHWKTANTALSRIREAFLKMGHSPQLFFIGAAVEQKMADEIWQQLADGLLSNAANLNDEMQVASISRWLCNL